jgi:hypothetical protein
MAESSRCLDIHAHHVGHVALGSDYPFPLRDVDPVATVRRQALSEADERALRWDTAAALLGLV